MTGANNYSFDSVNSKPPAPCNGSHRQPGTRHARVTVLISMPSRPTSFPRESRVEDGSQMIVEGLCEYAVGTAKSLPNQNTWWRHCHCILILLIIYIVWFVGLCTSGGFTHDLK
ncbi:hypothetical protein A0H81_12238 [Grifola frondosa]|uniref:Uncharacterized protein n=1 Tax=Grifola frondosa TaxID=5627 RepID=A0A1C7LYI9_GRIFR|nr:hypothetical protein A0H81_12238 [Grifola frondosa]